MRRLPVLGALLALAACQPPAAEMTPDEKARIQAEIDQVTDAIMVTWNAMDANGYASFFSPSRIALAWGGTVHRDIPSFRQRMQEWFDARTAFDGQWVDKTVEVLAPDAALFQGVYDATQHMADGRILRWRGTASWTVLFRLEEGAWKATYAVSASGSGEPVEPPGTPS